MDLDDIYNYFINYGIATEDEINLVTLINGYDEETFNDILYVKTGYRDMEQYLEYEDKETYKQYYGNNDED